MELLRIFSMYLIIVFHCAYHSNFPTPPPSTDVTYNALAVKIFWLFGEWGVNLFVLTSGYFQVKGSFKWNKLALLLGQTLFYSLITMLIGRFVGAEEAMGLENLLRSLTPVLSRQYWFCTAYVALYLVSPYLNLLITTMEKKSFQYFLGVLLCLYSIIPTIFGVITHGRFRKALSFFTTA